MHGLLNRERKQKGIVMVKVLFFAKLREDLGVSSLDVKQLNNIVTIADLVAFIVKEQGGDFAEHLASEQIVVSQNHEVVNRAAIIRSGDEIAFYPPVTGG